MKLFLTSAGFTNKKLQDFFLGNLDKSLGQTKVAMVALAQNSRERFYVRASKKELERLGFQSVKYISLSDDAGRKDLENFDLVYVCGGNTFAIYKRMKETGLADEIKKFVEKNNLIYAGVSAGSIIAGPSIEIAGWGSEGDRNDVGLEDLIGLEFTNVAVFPHYHKELEKEVIEFKNRVDYPVVELTNDQMVYFKNGNWEVI